MIGPDEHYTDELWSDFVRNALAPAAEEAMQAHLLAGCAPCAKTVELLGHVARFATAEPARAVPPALTAAAIGLFQPATAGPSWAEKLQAIAASLVWEQHPELLPQGVRSATQAGQRLVYRAGDYSVDLNIERLPGEPGEIIGQISNELDGHEPLDGILVQVVSPGRTLVETATNRFGEFIIEYPAAKSALLRFVLGQKSQRIDLPLKQ